VQCFYATFIAHLIATCPLSKVQSFNSASLLSVGHMSQTSCMVLDNCWSLEKITLCYIVGVATHPWKSLKTVSIFSGPGLEIFVMWCNFKGLEIPVILVVDNHHYHNWQILQSILYSPIRYPSDLFLAYRTNGRAYGTMLCPSVCLSSVTYVLWLNGTSYWKTVWRSK